MTRRALLIGSQTHGLRGVNGDVAAVDAFLAQHGFTRSVLVDTAAKREGILAGLRDLCQETANGDTVVVYYSGHGGRINNRRHLDNSSEPRTYACIIPFDHTAENFRGIFSAELAAFVAELSLKTRNITVVLDCCHAEEFTMGEELVPKAIELPWRDDVAAHRDWLVAAGYDLGARADYVESNPHVIRLVACRGAQVAYERVDAQGNAHGLLTEALLHVLDDVTDGAPAWHAIGEQILARVKASYPTQEPAVLGPVERLLFDTDTTPRTDVLAYVERDGQPFLSGGSLHGVTNHSRYLLMPLNANRADRELALAEAEVVEVFSDGARVTLEPQGGAAPPKPGTRAFLFDPQLKRHPVALDGLTEPLAAALATLLAASPRLRLADAESADTPMTVRVAADGGVALHDRDGHLVHHPWPIGQDPALALDVLRAVVVHAEQIARVRDLLDLPPAEGPTALAPAPKLRWGRVGDVSSVYLPSAGARLQVDDRIYIHAASESPSRVYVSILGVGVDRSIRLLSSSAPAGVELRPGEAYTLGQDQIGQLFGIPLAWHPDVPVDAAQPMTFVAVCTDIPVDLRSLESDASAAKGLARSLDELLDPQGQIVHKSSTGAERIRTARYYRAALELLLEAKSRTGETERVIVGDSTFVPKIDPLSGQTPSRPPTQYKTEPRTLPMKVIYISALPAGMQPLNFDAERRAIREALKRNGSRLYTFDDQPAASRADVVAKLGDGLDFLHISCHGEEQRGLLLQDDSGNIDIVPPEWLVERVEQNPKIGLVALSACHSDEHALAVAAALGIDAIGFRGKIGEHYARSFYGLLYELLARGLDVADAHDRALGALPEAIQGQVVRAGPGVFPARLVVVPGPFPPPPPPPPPLPFLPANIDFHGVDLAALGELDITELNTTATTGQQSLRKNVQFKLIDQDDGSRIGVYFARTVRIAPNASLIFTGPNAGALVALKEIKIFGAIDASPTYNNGVSPGGYKNGGGSNPRAGGPGGGASVTDMNGSAGGSYGGVGGKGAAKPDGTIAMPGQPYGTLEIVPLVGGSAGGGSNGGSGGGALQLVAGTHLLVAASGSVNSGGGGGTTGGAAGTQQGHGGGSGGAILIEAPTVEIKGVLAANGGGAGSGLMAWSLYGQTGLAGDQPALGTNPGEGDPVGARGSAAAVLDGEDGVFSPKGKCGGGGGGAGRIRINTELGAAVVTGIISPSLSTPCATQGKLRPR